MDVEQLPGENMILMVFLTLILTLILIIMLVTLVIVIFMVYMVIISLEEFRIEAAKKSISHSNGNVCPHCQSTISGSSSLPSAANSMTAPCLQAEATKTTEELQVPLKTLHNHSILPSRIDTAELENSLGKKDDLNIEANSTLHYIHSTLPENENEMLDLVQLGDTDHSANDILVITESNTNNNSDGEINDSEDNENTSSLNGTSKNNNVDVSEIQHVESYTEYEQENIVENTDSTNEKIKEPTVKISNSFENMESETDLEYIVNDTVVNTEQTDILSKNKVRKESKESDEEFSKKSEIAIRNNNFCDQDNVIIDCKENEIIDCKETKIIDCKENGSTQNSENVSDLEIHDANIENESYSHVANTSLEKIDIQCFETVSYNASQTLSHDESSEKLKSTTISSESNKSSKDIEMEETAIKVSVSTTTDIFDDPKSVNTDTNAISTDFSIKSLPETSVKEVQETHHKLPSNKNLPTAQISDDSPISHSSNLPLKKDLSKEKTTTDIKSNDTSKPNVSNASKSPGDVKQSTSTAKPLKEDLINKKTSTDIKSNDASKPNVSSASKSPGDVEHSTSIAKPPKKDLSNDKTSTDIKSNDALKPNVSSASKSPGDVEHSTSTAKPLKEDLSNKTTSSDIKSNDTSKPNVSSTSKSPDDVEPSTSTAKPSEDPVTTLFKKADEMYQNMDYDNLYILLKNSKIDQKNDDFLWRLGRVTWQRAMKETNYDEQISLHKEALGYVHSALALNETNGLVHRWISIITDYVAKSVDIRTRVAQSAVCRDHMFRAVEINPNDGVSWYLLGTWHYCAAELPWYQRQMAKALFSTDFKGTYEQALNYFLKGYKNNPEFYSTNVYMIGRCYQKMGRRSEAITWIRLARDYKPVRTDNDKETHEEATRTLKKLEAR